MARRPADSKLALRATWLATQALGRVSPRLAGRSATILWFTPWRLPQSDRSRAREEAWLRGSEPFEAAGLQGFVAGSGPVVLFVHGWGGWASRLGAFVDPLVENGYRVVAMDLPAHGASSGRQTNPFEMADALLAVAEAAGPVHAIVAHSFGGLVSLLAMERGLKPDGLVLLSAALRAENVRARFAELFRLRPSVMDALVRVLNLRFGAEVWEELDGVRIAERLAVRGPDLPILVAHDPEDPDAPFADARTLTRIFPGAQLLEVEGAGHHRMVVDDRAVAATVELVRRLRERGEGTTDATPEAGVDGPLGVRAPG